MTEPSSPPAPADEVLASSSALDDNAEVWIMFVLPSTQDNYSQIARDQAAARGVEPRQVLQEMADQWDQLHERAPLDGYDHLAAWARQHDPSAGASPTGLQYLQARTLESARRDPYQAVIGDQSYVEQAVAAQRTQDEQVAAAGAAPSVDPASGMLPNPGPLPVPTDVSTVDPAVAEQQQAAAEQRDPGEQLPTGDPAPSDTTTPPTADTTAATADATAADTPPPEAPRKRNGNGGDTTTTG